MPKIKTSELIGAQLDWAVAKCEGWAPTNHSDPKVRARIVERVNKRGVMACEHVSSLRYSTDWSLAGPIIERECISTQHDISLEHPGGWWDAELVTQDGDLFCGSGPTPLIAACRCFCASELGDEIEIPEELA